MYSCESWTIKKAECQRIDAFELWCWRRLLRVPWTARRSNQSILKEINPEYSLMLKLKFQYFGHLMRRSDSLEKTLMLGIIEGRRRRRWQRMRWLEGITDSVNVNLGTLWEIVRDREAWHAAVHGAAKSQAWLGTWTATTIYIHIHREISFEELAAYIIWGIGKSKIYRTGWQTGDPGKVHVTGQVWKVWMKNSFFLRVTRSLYSLFFIFLL